MSEKYLRRSTAIAARMLGGEMMVMSTTDSTFFSLNEVATAIWHAADGRTTLSQIVAQTICRQFNVEPAVAQSDAEQFVEELSQHGILLVSDKPGEGSLSVAEGS